MLTLMRLTISAAAVNDCADTHGDACETCAPPDALEWLENLGKIDDK